MMHAIELSGAGWVKSTRSTNGDCVEVARLRGGAYGVRDSKNQNGPVIILTPGEWSAFIDGVKGGEFGA